MSKLKNKVFFTIFLILSISVLSFIIVFNIQNYLEHKNSIIKSLRIATGTEKNIYNRNSQNYFDNTIPLEKTILEKENKPFESLNKNVKFMDFTIYTVLIDDNNNIKEVINHSSNEFSNIEINKVASSILKDKKIKRNYIGFLYLEKYSYAYLKGNALIILDNSNIKKSLIISLEISIFIFIILEVISLFFSKLITNWIITPVKSSFDRQKQFITDASHELKTPLSVIIASSEALEEAPHELKWLKNIRNEADRMNILITDLLELSASEREEIGTFKLGNLSKAVELSVLTFEGIAFEKNIKMEYKIADDIKMKMNENSIRQLVEILLDNAIKHSKEKGKIFVSLTLENNSIELCVKNKGEGIPKGEEEKIFERFYRVDKSRNRKENRYGLGLAIAKNIVVVHNGNISCNCKNGYTSFIVKFKQK